MFDQFNKVINSTTFRRGWRTKMITFTIPTNGDYEAGLKKINAAMVEIWEKQLRRDPAGMRITKNRKGVQVASGMMTALEFGPKTGNIHVHCLYFGPYIPRRNVYVLMGRRIEMRRETQSEERDLVNQGAVLVTEGLKDAWERLTGAFIVDVRPADKNSLREVLKYFTKVGEVSPAKLVEFGALMGKRRRIRTYGVFFDPQLEALADDEAMAGKECPTCHEKGTLIYEENLERWIERLFGKDT